MNWDALVSVALLMLTVGGVCYGSILLRQEVEGRRHDRYHQERVEGCGMCAWRSWAGGR